MSVSAGPIEDIKKLIDKLDFNRALEIAEKNKHNLWAIDNPEFSYYYGLAGKLSTFEAAFKLGSHKLPENVVSESEFRNLDEKRDYLCHCAYYFIRKQKFYDMKKSNLRKSRRILLKVLALKGIDPDHLVAIKLELLKLNYRLKDYREAVRMYYEAKLIVPLCSETTNKRYSDLHRSLIPKLMNTDTGIELRRCYDLINESSDEVD